MTTEVSTSCHLGRFVVCLPLRVDLQEQPDGTWLALLEPAELTCSEWGEGAGVKEALHDLETTIAEVAEHLRDTPDARLGNALLRYKRALAKYVSVNT